MKLKKNKTHLIYSAILGTKSKSNNKNTPTISRQMERIREKNNYLKHQGVEMVNFYQLHIKFLWG